MTDPTAHRRLPDGSTDELIREEPLLIRAGDGQVLTMRTPGDDEHLAVGFLLSEGIIAAARQIRGIDHLPGDSAALRPDTVAVAVDDVDGAGLRGRLTRTHEIRPSCGVCGLTDADELLEHTAPLLPRVPRLSRSLIAALRADFEARQTAFQRTGACHGAAVYDDGGALHGFGEDVGRHNALDKALGRAARSGFTFGRGIALLSGRAGYDLVLKCLRLGVPAILSVSAPSALGFDLCAAAGATLVGFLRPGRMKIYCDAGRITDAG